MLKTGLNRSTKICRTIILPVLHNIPVLTEIQKSQYLCSAFHRCVLGEHQTFDKADHVNDTLASSSPHPAAFHCSRTYKYNSTHMHLSKWIQPWREGTDYRCTTVAKLRCTLQTSRYFFNVQIWYKADSAKRQVAGWGKMHETARSHSFEMDWRCCVHSATIQRSNTKKVKANQEEYHYLREILNRRQDKKLHTPVWFTVLGYLDLVIAHVNAKVGLWGRRDSTRTPIETGDTSQGKNTRFQQHDEEQPQTSTTHQTTNISRALCNEENRCTYTAQVLTSCCSRPVRGTRSQICLSRGSSAPLTSYKPYQDAG